MQCPMYMYSRWQDGKVRDSQSDRHPICIATMLLQQSTCLRNAPLPCSQHWRHILTAVMRHPNSAVCVRVEGPLCVLVACPAVCQSVCYCVTCVTCVMFNCSNALLRSSYDEARSPLGLGGRCAPPCPLAVPNTACLTSVLHAVLLQVISKVTGVVEVIQQHTGMMPHPAK